MVVLLVKSDRTIRSYEMLECYVMLEPNAVDAEVDPPEKIRGRVAITYSCWPYIIFVSTCINFTHRLE